MTYVLLFIGIAILLVVVAAAIEAYVRSNTHRPLAASKPSARDVNRQSYRQGPNTSAGHQRMLDNAQKAETDVDRHHADQRRKIEAARQHRP